MRLADWLFRLSMTVPDPELSLELGCYALMLHALMLRAAVIRIPKRT
jgi:hypothetical protein